MSEQRADILGRIRPRVKNDPKSCCVLVFPASFRSPHIAAPHYDLQVFTSSVSAQLLGIVCILLSMSHFLFLSNQQENEL